MQGKPTLMKLMPQSLAIKWLLQRQEPHSSHLLTVIYSDGVEFIGCIAATLMALQPTNAAATADDDEQLALRLAQ